MSLSSTKKTPRQKRRYPLFITLLFLTGAAIITFRVTQQTPNHDLKQATGPVAGVINRAEAETTGTVLNLPANKAHDTGETEKRLPAENKTAQPPRPAKARDNKARDNIERLQGQLADDARELLALEAKIPMLTRKATLAIESEQKILTEKHTILKSAQAEVLHQKGLHSKALASAHDVQAAELIAQKAQFGLKQTEALLEHALEALNLTQLAETDIQARKRSYETLKIQLQKAQSALPKAEITRTARNTSKPESGI